MNAEAAEKLIELAQGPVVSVSTTPIAPPLFFDWTINVGHVLTILSVVFAAIIIFHRQQWRLDDVEKRLKHFDEGLDEFKRDFKEMGGQVVRALLAIARLEAKDPRSLNQILREEEEAGRMSPHEMPSMRKRDRDKDR